MSQSPSGNDTKWVLIMKVSTNLYDAAIASSISGLNPPSINDTDDTLWKKAAYISARLADA